ncbi:MAG: T9SS type A sorting domain-containing protein [Bacteroidales bacterium]|nr:T9SS type A sorting domain-containing protein [Bacteroidales bacterium]
MKTIIRLLTVAFLFASVTEARAEKYHFEGQQSRNLKQVTAGCTPSSTFAWLNINNARVRVNAGGDMWWDLPGGSGSKYYIPANGSATSLYAGSLWIAGMDVNNQLKCSAVRFRQKGNDFWTGPLTTDGTASIDAQTCMMYDKMYNITRAEVDDFLAHFDTETGKLDPNYTIPANIANWPAHGQAAGVSHYLAPFFDYNEDGEYDPSQGDYPYYDIDNELCHTQVPTMEEERAGTVKGSILADQVIKGDQTIWWVFNDKGNSHTETGGSAIGMEIRAQAFAFATNDEINNMTFYSYEIINRSTYTLTNTYFSPWTDVDLGYAKDDYVGCDVSRGLGYGYNGAPVDGNGETEAYGPNPPAVGVDFFQGPYLDPDGIDNPKYTYTEVGGVLDSVQNCDESINGVNFGNGIPDDERYGMRRFVYHNNTGSNVNGDPEEAAEYYLLLQGIWKNGAKMEYGGTAVPGAAGTVGPACDFMFPFDSDPCNWGTGGIVPNGGFNQNGFYWSEETGDNGNPNPVEDRRFMQSAGPFTLKAGAVNYITFGVPWARANTGKAWASVELLRKVDDKCQSMFDNCFKVLDGPNAPDLTIRELDRSLIIYLSNSATSNNAGESYVEKDPNIQGPHPIDSTQEKDPYYRFEGYQVYQLANERVSVDELNDETKARLVFQCDVKNNVSTIINFIYNEDLKRNVPTMMVQGGDNGIRHSFIVTQDKFTTNNDPTLVNHKTYYFMAIAYAYNSYMEYSDDPNDLNGLYGQKEPYLAGRKNIKLYSAVPHKIVNGTVVNSVYNDQPQITRWVGLGNGGLQTEIIDSQIEELLAKAPANYTNGPERNIYGMESYPVIYHPTYKKGYGPVNVKIVDPLNVLPADYSLRFTDFAYKTMYHVTGDQGIAGDSAQKYVFNWILTDVETGEEFRGSKTTEENNEQLFLERGISVDILQSWDFGPIKVGTVGAQSDQTASYEALSPQNGMITSSVTYADSSYRWLSGIRDSDVLANNALNWIRSGTYRDTGEHGDPANNDYNMKSGEFDKGSKPYDPTEDYENIAEGTWAPYMFCNKSGNAGVFNPGPVYPKDNCREDTIFHRMGSIDIVLTADKSKWTRCPVVEMCMDKNLSEGNMKRFSLRHHASVDRDGNYAASMDMEASDDPNDPNYISAHGMGWFPGYAIDIETGARLNLLYGEDSFYPDLNGRDMMFNPPALMELVAQNDPSFQIADPVLFDQIDGTAVFGGKHFVYIFPMVDNVTKGSNSLGFFDFGCPAYDAGRKLYETLDFMDTKDKDIFRVVFWSLPVWVGMPMAIEGKEWLPENNPVKISVRINTPYKPGYGTMVLDTITDYVMNDQYDGLNPYYTFSTKGCEPTENVADKAENDLDLIKIVPNPYYAFSNYEGNALTHKVKIVNVPDKCVVTIYTVNGTKIRQFKKDDATTTSIDWDLTNHANTPIASGIYLIHVKDQTTGGERTVKFYCAMRPVDLNTF